MRILVVGLLCALASSGVAAPKRDVAQTATAAGVQLLLIDGVREFPEAAEVGAIRFACAQDEAALRRFFAERAAPFRESLVHKRNGYKSCHIFYEPTVPGFRALPDDKPIRGLVSGIDPASLVGGRKTIGDSLDIAREVLKRIERPVAVTFSLTDEFERSYWPDGLARAFPESRHRFTLTASEANETHPWGQDFVKAGQVNGELRILTPRRLFEGRGEDGEIFRPLLEAMKDGPYVRSKLAWEGGDLQFIADPKDPSRIILFHGGAARDYWGTELERKESSYVLQVEFGADAAIDMSLVGPHADYLAAFLPEAATVLVARPVHNDLDLALAAAQQLHALYGERAPMELTTMEALLRQASGPDPSPQALELVQSKVQRLLTSVERIEAAVPHELKTRLGAHDEAYCPSDPAECYVGEGKRRMHRVDPDLMKAVYDAAADAKLEPIAATRFLRLIESQLPNVPDTMSGRIEDQVVKIKKLGFRVIRVPYLYSPEAQEEWPGISYANSLLVDKTLFVPAVGLGKYEERLFREMRKRLPKGYELVPVYARFGLMNNGGVHCVFGVIRDPGAPAALSGGG